MNFIEIAILVGFLFFGIKIINLAINVVLTKNIENIKKRKKGLLYHYAKMRLGENIFK